MFETFYEEQKKPPIVEFKEIYEDKNAIPIEKDGKIIAYEWGQGDSVSIPINLNPTVLVEEDAIISTTLGIDKPTEKTTGFVGQRFYNPGVCNIQYDEYGNIIDYDYCEKESYTMISYLNFAEIYVWEKDDTFMLPEIGTNQLVLIKNMDNKYIKFTLLDFRKEIITEQSYYSSKCDFYLSKEDSEKILKGVYTLVIQLISDESQTLLEKYQINVV